MFPESKNLGFDKEPWKTIVHLASKIANFPRHLSIHPSGIVITPSKITDYCALEYAKNKGLGLIITQPDMYSIEDLGLVKIDLLSQRSLGVLRDTMEKLNKRSADKLKYYSDLSLKRFESKIINRIKPISIKVFSPIFNKPI